MPSNAPRLVELDILRGLAVAGMILVNSPGSWSAAWLQLQHPDWSGARLADMVFPTFLFSVGVALGLSFPRAWRDAADRHLFWRRVLRRVAALIAIGLAIEASYNLLIGLGAGFPGQASLAYVRLPGILQRIALCYLLGTALLVWTGRRDLGGRLHLATGPIALAILVVLAGYWAAMALVPVPGFGAGRLDPAGNLAAYLDRAILTPRHMWLLGTADPRGGPVVFDPEGLLSTFPATANLLFGVLAAMAYRRAPEAARPVLAMAGVAGIVAGLLIAPAFPLNKHLWTSSFALLSAGVSALLLAGLMACSGMRGLAAPFAPLRVLGGNAILAFILSAALSRIGSIAWFPGEGRPITPQRWGDKLALSLVSDPGLASFLCALAVLVLVTAMLWPLHRRAIHFRV